MEPIQHLLDHNIIQIAFGLKHLADYRAKRFFKIFGLWRRTNFDRNVVRNININYNLDIEGTTIFVGGERLSREGYQFMASAGVRVLPRYVSTETGLIAASCGERENTDSMHVYLDRMAVIHDKESNRLLFTTILQTTPKLLLNTDLGDTAFLQNRQCNCIFGKLEMDLFVSDVRTTSKQTLEGMSIFLYELDAIVGQIIREDGGRTEDYQ